MANDDLNFNLDEFLASHSQGTKHMHSPKKKRTTQSPTRAAAAQKAAERKRQAQACDNAENENAQEEKQPLQKAADAQEQKNENIDTAAQLADFEEKLPQEPQDHEIFIAAAEPQIDESKIEIGKSTLDEQHFTESENFQGNALSDEDFDDAVKSNTDDIADIVDTVDISDTVDTDDVADVADTVNTADTSNESKADEQSSETLDPEYFFRKDIKLDMPDFKPKKDAAPSEEVPKYKERTSEISFATKRRLTDTASVGVRRLSESERPNARVYTKHTEGEEKNEEEKKRLLEEQLRLERELTEKILRKAYEQEKEQIELGSEALGAAAPKKHTDLPKENGELQKKNKRAKNKKTTKKAQPNDSEEHSLLVVQVGTGNEDNSQSIIDVLENALDEDVIELEYVSKTNEESHSYESRPEKKKNKAQTLYFFIGLFFTLMSVIGIVVTAKSLVSFVANVSDDSKQKQEFAEYIYPVVIADPAAFESVSDLSDEAIIKAAIWDIIIYDDVSKYTRDGSNNMYVPYIQVENHAKSLFGTTNIVHTTVAFSQELTFFYDSENRMYKVPVSPQLFPNTPVVREIDKVGERYTLTVDYQEPTPNWELMNSDYTPGIKKTMKYVLTKYNDGYTIISINNVD